MRIKTVVFSMTLTALVFPAITNASQDLCAEVQTWKAPQRIYSKLEEKNLLVVTKDKKLADEAIGARVAGPGSYSFIKNGQGDNLGIVIGKDYSLKISIPEYQGRPLEAKWINPKLLFIEVWFGPHYGAYWIFDVEQEHIVYGELQNDGVDAWRQCREKAVGGKHQ